MPIGLVPAADADVPAVVALMNRAYRGGHPAAWNSESYIAGTRTTEALLRADIATYPHGRQLVWRRPNADDPAPGDRAPDDAAPIAGTVWVAPYAGEAWYLGALAIDPAAQNEGLGRELLAAAERWIADHGGRSVRMTVINIRAGLLAWYERRGYRLTDETEPFPYGDDRFGVPTRDDLFFVVLVKQLV